MKYKIIIWIWLTISFIVLQIAIVHYSYYKWFYRWNEFYVWRVCQIYKWKMQWDNCKMQIWDIEINLHKLDFINK